MAAVMTAPSAGVPVQPVIPVNEVAVVPVYEQPPLMPAMVKAPLVPKPLVEATLRVPPPRLWLPPLTVVWEPGVIALTR